MKTVNLLAGLLLVLFTMASCSGDDENSNNGNPNNDSKNNLIVGVWSEYRYKLSGNEEWITVIDPITVEFQSNGTLIGSYNGTVEETGTWSISGNTLIENWEDETINSEILILNETTLQLKETLEDGEWGIYEYKKEQN